MNIGSRRHHPARWALGILAIVVAPLLVSCTSPEPSVDLSDLLLSDSQLSAAVGSTYSLAAIESVDVGEVVGTDALELSRVGSGVLAIMDARYEPDSGGPSIRTRVVAFENSVKANELRPQGEAAVSPPFPPNSRVLPAPENYSFVVNSVKGRIQIIVYIDGDNAQQPPSDSASTPAARVLRAQVDAVPQLEDTSASTDLSTIRLVLIMLEIAIIPIIAIGLLIAASLRDRGTIERLRRGANVPTDSSTIRNISAQTRLVRKDTRRRGLVFVLAATMLSALFVYIKTLVRLPILLELAMAPAALLVVAIVNIYLSRRSKHNPQTAESSTLPSIIGTVGSTLYLYGATYMITAAIAIIVLTTAIATWLIAAVMVVIAIRILSKSSNPLRYAKRLAAPEVADTLKRDSRREVMLLRSFQDDNLNIRMHRTARHNPIEVASSEPFERFEELLAWSLWRFGPVVAIGQPNTPLTPLGAAREYHDDDSWQSVVESRLGSSVMVVFIVGRSPGLAWEVSRAMRTGVLSKCLFVFPPGSASESQDRLTVLANTLGLAPESLPPISNNGPFLIGLYFSDDGIPMAVVVDGRDDLAYQTLFTEVGAELVNRIHVPLYSPAALFSAAPRDVGQLLVTYDPTLPVIDHHSVLDNVRFLLSGVRVDPVTGTNPMMDELDATEAVTQLRALIYSCVQNGDYERVYDEFLSPRCRKAIPRSPFVEQNRQHNIGRDFSGPETVSVTTSGLEATAYVEAYDGTPTSPQRFVRISGKWYIDMC